MQIKNGVRSGFAALALCNIGGLVAAGAQDAEPMSIRVLKWNDEEQAKWIKSYLRDRSAPLTDALAVLVLSKSSLVIPILQQAIEENILSRPANGPATSSLADPRGADSERIVSGAVSMIEYAGDEQSLRAASKLMKIDEHRFGGMVSSVLLHAGARRNPFKLAYRGFDIGNPAVDRRILAWAETIFALKGQADHIEKRQWWAEAIVEQYRGVPTGSQWTNDPLVSRLDPNKYVGLHDEMLPLIVEAARKQSKQ